MTNLVGMPLTQLRDLLAGQALESTGSGTKMNTIVETIMLTTLRWKEKNEAEIEKARQAAPDKELAERAIAIIAEQLAKPVDAVKLEDKFVDDLGADSLDQVEIVMALEEAFSLEIPEHEQEKILTVRDAVNYIASQRKK